MNSAKVSLLGSVSFSTNSGDASNRTADFGFDDIPADERKSRVKEIFSSVASNYDLMNDVMSAGIHRLWKDEFVSMIGIGAGARMKKDWAPRFLDVAGGTGDIAFRIARELLEHQPSITADSSPMTDTHTEFDVNRDTPGALKVDPVITVCDINPGMLAVGKERLAKQGYPPDLLTFEEGDAEELTQVCLHLTPCLLPSFSIVSMHIDPVNSPSLSLSPSLPLSLSLSLCLSVWKFPAESFDVYTIAFGLRNVTDKAAALRAAYRVLRPGGRLLILEFSHVTTPVLQQAYDMFSMRAIPALGQLVAGDAESYRYLVESIRRFPRQEELLGMLREAGFRAASFTNLSCGVVAIHSGYKL